MSVCAAVATYNGADYVGRLLESLPDDILVFVSDDCSTDTTLASVKAARSECLIVSEGVRYGSAKKNFSALLKLVAGHEYVFLCDQDDAWLNNKFLLSINKMMELEAEYGSQTPILIFTDAIVVDASERVISESFLKYEGLNPDFINSPKNLFLQNVGQGATMLVNKSLLSKALPVPDAAIMHDWWLMLVAATFGKIGYIDQPTLLYRQHDKNVLGAKRATLLAAVRKVVMNSKIIKESIRNTQLQAAEFLKRYEEGLSPDFRNFLAVYSGFDRLSFLSKRIFCVRQKLIKSGLYRTIGFYFFV